MPDAYSGTWSNRGRLAYAERGPFRPASDPRAHDGSDGSVQANALERITGPKREGVPTPGLIEDGPGYAPQGYGGGWAGDRTRQGKDRGYVGRGGADALFVHREALAAHGEDLGAVDEFTQSPPRMFQEDRSVVGWNRGRVKPLGHGSTAALGRGLNGLDKNNDPEAQHYAINQVGVGRVDRKFPGRRVWTRYLTPFRIRVAAQAVPSAPSEISPATSWARTMTLARTGKTTQPMMRRAPRDWTEAVTVDDSASGTAEFAEPAWGL